MKRVSPLHFAPHSQGQEYLHLKDLTEGAAKVPSAELSRIRLLHRSTHSLRHPWQRYFLRVLQAGRQHSNSTGEFASFKQNMHSTEQTLSQVTKSIKLAHSGVQFAAESTVTGAVQVGLPVSLLIPGVRNADKCPFRQTRQR